MPAGATAVDATYTPSQTVMPSYDWSAPTLPIAPSLHPPNPLVVSTPLGAAGSGSVEGAKWRCTLLFVPRNRPCCPLSYLAVFFLCHGDSRAACVGVFSLWIVYFPALSPLAALLCFSGRMYVFLCIWPCYPLMCLALGARDRVLFCRAVCHQVWPYDALLYRLLLLFVMQTARTLRYPPNPRWRSVWMRLRPSLSLLPRLNMQRRWRRWKPRTAMCTTRWLLTASPSSSSARGCCERRRRCPSCSCASTRTWGPSSYGEVTFQRRPVCASSAVTGVAWPSVMLCVVSYWVFCCVSAVVGCVLA